MAELTEARRRQMAKRIRRSSDKMQKRLFRDKKAMVNRVANESVRKYNDEARTRQRNEDSHAELQRRIYQQWTHGRQGNSGKRLSLDQVSQEFRVTKKYARKAVKLFRPVRFKEEDE